MNFDASALNQDAMQAMANRRLPEARRLLAEAIRLDPNLLSARMNLAVVQRLEGDLAGAMATLDAVRKIDPLFFPALMMRGALFEEMGKRRMAAGAYNIALTQMPPDQFQDMPTRRAIAHALELHAGFREEMHQYLKRDGLPTGHSLPAQRMNHFVDRISGKRRAYRSQPTNFDYPGLPSIEIYDRDLFPWLPELEAATPVIQSELMGVFDDEVAASDIEPYTQKPDDEPIEQWGELNHSRRWSAYHFAFYGKQYPEHRKKCPQTVALLDRFPQPRIANRSPASMFSILQPKVHIPPHNGVANFRLLCHLPLILPPDCRLRVGSTTREWVMGEAFVFDDTIEHEAWNDSDQMRTVMIFDIWHPFLTDDEKEFITRILADLDAFNAQEG